MSGICNVLTKYKLMSILYYDPLTGIFRWKIKSNTTINVGDIAGATHCGGYITIGLLSKRYLAHRLAWLYMTGNHPKEQIDHINGIRSDNRFCNLREATNLQNSRNKGILSFNKSGYTGVRYKKDKNKYVAYITIDKVQIFIGYYKTAELANEARTTYAKKCFGEFYHE